MSYLTAADGVRLQFDDQGQGVPILCLNGLSRNMDDFLPVLRAFGGAARIIRMDYRGRGGSDWPGPETYTIPQELADVITLLDHLGLEKVAILGTSRGGLIAMGLASTVKDRLLGVCLNDIGPVVETDGLSAIMDYLGNRPGYQTMAEGIAALPAIYPSFQNVPEESWVALAATIWTEGPEGLELRYDARLRDAVAESFTGAPLPPLWPLFDAMAGLPLALIRGANSNLLSADTAAEMRARRPDMLFADLPDRGHAPFLDEPAALALIGEWIDQLR